MTNEKKEEIIAVMTGLLEQLTDNEPPKTEQTSAPEKVEMLTIKECTEVVKGLNEYTVRQLIARKEIPSIRTGQGKRGKTLVPKAALIEYFSRCKLR